MKKRLFWKISLTIICLISLPLLAQQFLETRILELDRQEKYAEALALCERNADLSVAAYFAGEYTASCGYCPSLENPKPSPCAK